MKVSVRVTPKARRERFEKTGEHEFAVAVREAPERNEANTRVQRLVAAHYNVPLTSVRFLTGTRTKKKVFEVVQSTR
jgi:uncharacterized protein YggU (UPF0235/DUF167 family)